ncbi:unnamed protein product [Musa acuminata subsp. malaccensis]|uniref:(wild Malaysian banana) hypothetical protein n=1 Tax=Musa acuminata subsp. malaccensis TaxID=214687 RepID=A0A804KS76_MUSAM|nr:unnamed protein product [Musa acuminata subsp. malaccensis]
MYKYVLTFLTLGSTFEEKAPKAIKEIKKSLSRKQWGLLMSCEAQQAHME